MPDELELGGSSVVTRVRSNSLTVTPKSGRGDLQIEGAGVGLRILPDGGSIFARALAQPVAPVTIPAGFNQPPVRIGVGGFFNSSNGIVDFEPAIPVSWPGVTCLKIKCNPCALFVTAQINWNAAVVTGHRTLQCELITDGPENGFNPLKDVHNGTMVPVNGLTIGAGDTFDQYNFPFVGIPDGGGPWYLGLSALVEDECAYDNAAIFVAVVALQP